ncbi:MAG: 50S ribosomal protein L13 [Candidatus Blackburnbacteria bacterium]|nr:50S ribosomal protein L13 [Candidatus Blackburnbacteria bacterium]
MAQLFKTYHPKVEDIKREWHLVDVKDQILGRTATKIAALLMGKRKRIYSPHVDMGDYVVVVNSSGVRVTGNKEENKVYYRHSGYPGGLRATVLEEQRKKNPNKIVELAVKRMLPTNRLRDKRLARLKVFSGSEHSYERKFEVKN